MRIKTLKVANWRSFVSEEVEFQDLVILIGQNNHGKSNLMAAILYFFGDFNHDEYDFHLDSEELYVEIEFSDLGEIERNTFKKYVTSFNTIKVRKTGFRFGSFKYNGFLEQPTRIDLDETWCLQQRSRDNAQNLPFYALLPEEGRIKVDDIAEARTRYIQINKDSLDFEYGLEDSDFLGHRNVARGLFGELHFIPSIKNASQELGIRGKSLFGNLYSQVLTKLSESNPEYIAAKEQILKLSELLNSDNTEGENNLRPSEISELEDEISAELTNWNTRITLEITPPDVEDIFRLGAQVLVDDGVKTNIDRKGHGLQRALIFALIKAYSKIISNQNRESGSTRQASLSTYFLFEEPELYLHPQAQKEHFAALTQISQQENTQVILCTHSSSFIDLSHYKSICIVKKPSIESGSKIVQVKNDLFTDLKDKKRFDMVYYINPDRGELFFAKKVILVEGQTDKTIIPLLAKMIGCYRYDYTIIDCASKSSIPSYLILLNNYQIPYIAVCDYDHHDYKNQDEINGTEKLNNIIQAKIHHDTGSLLYFVNDIEEEIGMTLVKKQNKPYRALSRVQTPSFQISESLRAKIIQIFS